MGRLLLIFFMTLPLYSIAQLSEFKVEKADAPKVHLVQANADFPDNALLIIYSSLPGLNFRSSMGTVNKQTYNPQLNRYEILMEPIKQILFVNAKGYREKDISTLSPKPKDVFYFSVEEDEGSKEIKKAKFSIKTSPPNALISVNGLTLSDRTPADFELHAGRTLVGIHKPRYFSVDTLLFLNADEKNYLSLKLLPEWADLFITAKPSNAAIKINGKQEGVGKLELAGEVWGITAGTYRISVELDKYKPYQTNLTLTPGQTERLNIELQPILGKLDIQSEPSGADIYIENKKIGKTPYQEEHLIGNYGLTLQKSGFKEERKTIAIKEGQQTAITFSMTEYAKKLKPMTSKQNILYGVGLVGTGVALYYRKIGDDHYEAYKTATSNATDLRRKVEQADRNYYIAISAGAVGLLGGYIYTQRIDEYKKNWKIAAGPDINGGFITLNRSF